MPKVAFEPCIPTRGTKVPSGPEWLHEIKHDGYRLIVQREGKRVRLFARNGQGLWSLSHTHLDGDDDEQSETF
jgi:ATP-dependent DNA ligase